MRTRRLAARLAIGLAPLAALLSTASAAEPNENIFEATILPPGVLIVQDELGEPIGGGFPDTVVGSRGFFGDIDFYSDDDGPWSDSGGSALYNIPTNSGQIDFAVSGYPDEGFFGDHGELGDYSATVTVFDFFDDEVDSFTVTGSLSPGVVDEYSYSDFNWLNGYYNVEVNNTIGGGAGDVDFFTFTGLTPGVEFSAETFDPSGAAIDTVLAWYDESGFEITQSDDEGSGTLSLIEGTVPASGTLTFGVTGYPDFSFIGDHLQQAPYELVISVPGDSLAGDFNSDSTVDAADYTVWRDQAGTPAEYAEWADNYGATATSGAVPEPSSVLMALGLAALVASHVRR